MRSGEAEHSSSRAIKYLDAREASPCALALLESLEGAEEKGVTGPEIDTFGA